MQKSLFAALFLGAATVAFPALAEDIAIALHVEPGHEMFQVGERLKKNIEEKSEGRFTVTLLGTEVGGERDHLEGASSGEYQIALGGSMPMTLYAPQYAGADLPFVFDSSADAKKVYEGEMGDQLRQAVRENGNLELVGLSIRNPRNLTSKTQVTTPDDVQGVRMRVPEIAPWVQIWTEIGALPSPIAWPEVYTALQTGVIDMHENPVDYIWSGKLFEVQSYVAKTEHVHSFFHWLMNEDFYEGLAKEDQAMLQESIDEAIGWGDELVTGNEAKLYEQLQEKGMQIVEPDVAAFRAKAAPAIRQIADGFAPEVRDYVLSKLN